MDSIFIGGCPRSGTTLLASYFGTLPNFVVTPESQFKEKLIYDCNFNESNLIDCNWLLKQHSFRIWLQNKEFASRFGGYSSRSSTISLNILVGMYGSIIDQNFTWVDHTPSNILHIDKLNNFNSARFIHIIRDGRAVAKSVVPLPWGPNDYIHASNWWIRYVSAGLSAELSALYTMISVKYESIIESERETVGALFVACDIKYPGNSLTSRRYDLPVYTRSQHKLLDAPLRPLIDISKDKNNHFHYCVFEILAGPLLKNLKYSLICNKPYRLPIYLKYFLVAKSFIRKNLNLFKQYFRKLHVKFS